MAQEARGVVTRASRGRDQPAEAACPYCDSAQAPEAVTAGRYWCPCCAREFEVGTRTITA